MIWAEIEDRNLRAGKEPQGGSLEPEMGGGREGRNRYGMGYGMAAQHRTLYDAADQRYQGSERSDKLGVPGDPGESRMGLFLSGALLRAFPPSSVPKPTNTTHRTHAPGTCFLDGCTVPSALCDKPLRLPGPCRRAPLLGDLQVCDCTFGHSN